MVKKLRKKFVLVTTSLMMVVFGGFLLINTLYSNYWNDMEIAEMLDWIARSGIFTQTDRADVPDEIFLEMLDTNRPIIGMLLDANHNIISTCVIGDDKECESMKIDDQILVKMLQNGRDKFKIGHYYYSYNKMEDTMSLLVIMDDHFDRTALSRQIGMLLLIGMGILAMLGITFYLSRFVTEPAEQSLLREKQFISDASHELKTPLGAISINAQALALDHRDNLYLKNIISESDRMHRLIERLLMLSKLEESEVNDLKKISISDICEEMVLTYETIAYEKKIEFVYDIEQDIYVMGNEDELRQLLVILIDNAIKNVNERGNIEFICKKEHVHAQLTISNTGHGIVPEELVHIFDRFYTTDKSRNHNSFGLGLAIAKSIVERHGGTIEARSEQDKRTEFIVVI